MAASSNQETRLKNARLGAPLNELRMVISLSKSSAPALLEAAKGFRWASSCLCYVVRLWYLVFPKNLSILWRHRWGRLCLLARQLWSWFSYKIWNGDEPPRKVSHPRLKSMHTNNLLGLLTASTRVGSRLIRRLATYSLFHLFLSKAPWFVRASTYYSRSVLIYRD